ncbi:MAG TPA: ABC-F family ATP-binding cassette domain-containing protein [Frankiaceae bacterium]|nr:ABC-F family ATP-binding cassette domain-containing protein [Frankiaceae bacterium]
MLVTLDAVSRTRGTTLLLDRVSLGIDDRDRIGVVGRNGAGKSTLARVIAGQEAPDTGRVAARAGIRVALLTQDDTLPDSTVGDLLLSGLAEHEWAGNAAAREVLEGLGLRDRLDTQLSVMSGGERRRAALGALLVADAIEGTDLLMLDEPTNHLDVEGVDWLAQHLRGRRGALLVVTHDRWFLDAVCETTWEVGGGGVASYDGGYAAYVLAKAERDRSAAVTEARRKNLLRKELAWLRRGPPARTSKPRFRIDAANALIADEPPPRESMLLRRTAAARLGKSVYDVEDVTMAYGGRVLLGDVTWRVGPGDRFGLIGVNGAGKSTLLRLLDGRIPPQSGQVKVGATVRPAYLTQDVAELDPQLRVLQAVEETGNVLATVDPRAGAGGGRELTAGQLLESFGFPTARQWTRVGDLSGGERRRLQILRLLLGGANVLLLDEPTNDLDIDTLQALEDVLDTWPGSLIVVSHDRWFLERVTDTIVALTGDGRLAALPGGVDEYLEIRKRAAAAAPPSAPAKRAGDTRAAERQRNKELLRLERLLERLDRRERKLHDELAAAATDAEKVLRLDADLRAVIGEKAEAEEGWLLLATSEGEE